MDAETREALEAVRSGIFYSIKDSPQTRERARNALRALSRIEQTLRDLSERVSHDVELTRLRNINRQLVEDYNTLLVQSSRERDALAERVERAERERDEALRPDAEWQQEVRRIVAERDALAERLERAERDVRVWMNEKASAVRRAEAAEAETARLKAALREIRGLSPPRVVSLADFEREAQAITRAALSPPTDGEAG